MEPGAEVVAGRRVVVGGGGWGWGVVVGFVAAECAYFCLRTIICMFQLRCLECHRG